MDGSSDFTAEAYGDIDTPIDHVFARGDLAVASARAHHPWVLAHGFSGDVSPQAVGPRTEWALRTYGSDHMPVGCTLHVRCGRALATDGGAAGQFPLAQTECARDTRRTVRGRSVSASDEAIRVDASS